MSVRISLSLYMYVIMLGFFYVYEMQCDVKANHLWGEGVGNPKQQAQTHTLTHSQNWPQVAGGMVGSCDFLKPRAVLETGAAHSSIRYRSSPLDLLFTKKNPSLLKCPLCFSLPFQQHQTTYRGKNTRHNRTCVHHNIPRKSKFHLDGGGVKKFKITWTQDVG